MQRRKWKKILCGFMSAIFLLSEAGSATAYAANDTTEITQTQYDSKETEASEEIEASEETENDTDKADIKQEEADTESSKETEAVTEDAKEGTEIVAQENQTDFLADDAVTTVEPGTIQASAVQIECGKLYEFTTLSSTSGLRNSQYLKIKLNSPGNVSIGFANLTSTDGKDVSYYLYDSSTNTIAATTDAYLSGTVANGTVNVAQQAKQVALKAGEYYIRIDKTEGDAATKCQIEVNYTALTSTYYDLESNNTYSNASAVPLNTVLSGSSYKNGDEDYYKFTLEKAGVVHLVLKHAYVANSNNLYTGALYYMGTGSVTGTEQLQEAFEFSSIGTQTEETTSLAMGLEKGTYYYKITSAQNDADSYQFEVLYEESESWEKEPNNATGTATPIAIGQSYSGSICKSGDKDYYKVVIEKDGIVTLDFTHAQITGKESTDLWKVSWNSYSASDGTTTEVYSKTFNGSAQTTGTNTNKVAVSAGTYYVCVEAASTALGINTNFDSSTYQIKVLFEEASNLEKESNDTSATANTIEVGQAYSGSIGSSTDDDWYQVTLAANGVLDIRFTHDMIAGSETTSLWKIAVYSASDLNSVMFSRYITGGATDVTTPQIGLPAGAYYICVSPARSTSWNGSFYTLQANFVSSDAWETEANNSVGAADAITLGNTYYGSIHDSGDTDYYKVELKENSVLTVNFKHEIVAGSENTPLWQVELCTYSNSAGTTSTIYQKTINGGTEEITLPQVGLTKDTYYICVKGVSASSYDTGTYQLSVNSSSAENWELESNNSYASATVAAMNQAYSGSIHASSDKDYYKVTMEADGALQVKFTHNIVAGSESSKLWNISVYRSTDLSNAVFTQTVIGGDKTTTTAQMGLKKGDYYVLVAPESSIKYDDTTYKIQMNYTKSAYWEKEDNDSSQTATAISNFDKKYSGSIYKQADTDWYEVTLAGNGGFGLTFTNAVVEGSEGKAVWKVSIYKSSDVKTAVYEQTITGGDTKTVMPQIGMKKGTYYVCVQSGRSSTFSDQTYKLKVNYDQSDYWEIEGNDAFDTATTLTSGKTYTGSIKTKDDYDYYRIDTKKKGYLQFKLTQSSKSTDKIYRIKVYNGDKTELYSTEVAGNDATFNSCKIGVDKGTYYVRIEEYVSLYTGNYKLTVTGTAASNWETEVNDNRTAADKMTVGTTIYGVCDASYAKDDDYYKFTLDKAAYVNVSLSHKDLNGSSTAWSIYIYDSNGRRVDHKNDYLSVKQSGTYAETNCVKLPKGTYYIQVRATEYGTGVEYGLTVNKISAKTPVISSVTAKAYNQMKVSWSVVPGASKYMIYRSTSKNGKYSLVKTISSAATTSWTDKDVKTGKTYYYKIKASVTTNKTTTSGYSKVKSAKCVPAKPAGVKAASSTKNQVKVSWNKVSGASGYEIYRKEKNGEYKKIKTITNGSTVTYTDKSAKSGKTYTYKIRAYRTVDSKKVYSSYSKEVTQKAK